MPLISVIIPVFKVEKYLQCCLDSVLSQTFTDYECILVDDGSPDNCSTICDEYADKDMRFKVIHKENGGLSDARNVGIQEAVGEYLVLLDSDDFFTDTESLNNLAKVIHKKKPVIIFNSCSEIIGKNNRTIKNSVRKHINCFTPYRFYNKVMSKKNNLMAGWLFCIQRIFLLEHQLFFKKGLLHEDELWMPKLICSVDMIEVNHSPFYTYRKGRSDSITSSSNIKNLNDKLFIIKDLQIYLENNKFSKQHRDIIKCRNAQLWYGIFSQLATVKWTNDHKYLLVLCELDKLKNILFFGKKIKYRLLFILLLFFSTYRLITFLKVFKK